MNLKVKGDVALVMGSVSDYETMKEAEDMLRFFDVTFFTQVLSAHRSPEAMFDFAKSARQEGVKVIIAGAGGAAHLPGMISSLTTVPVLGVPIQSKSLLGLDSLLSIVQMPGGVPTATFAIGSAGAKNAAIFATQILALSRDDLQNRLEAFKRNLDEQAKKSSENLTSYK